MADRWWFFEVAALAARGYANPGARHQATPPSHVRTPSLRTTSAGLSGEAPTITPSPAPRTERPARVRPTFPGTAKVAFIRKLANDWEELADLLDIPPHTKAQFRAEVPARALWEWLEVRDRLPELPAALDRIDRKDLAEVLRNSISCE
ncbi:hypothetical protein [Actinoplanes sp. NPDC051851]|uniref:hypothetical protein n=1 Tax=Actinoplanes sp. NPDC051851 TaxID=3154753 RepID=UPI003434E5A5